MKGKKVWRRWLCAILAMVLMSNLSVAAYAEEGRREEWTYENSILVTVLTEKEKSFTVSDFSEINCTSVWIVDKAVAKEGIVYELVLTLKNGNEAEIEKAMQALSQSAMVKRVQRNEKFALPKSKISLNKSTVYLEIGEEANLSIQDINMAENSIQNIGVVFLINPEVYDEDAFEKDSFRSYGIEEFWPNTEKGEEILVERPEELEAQKSKDGKYYGVGSEDIFETVNNLAKLPGILSVSVVQMTVPGGEPPYEDWIVNKSEIIELKLSGGDIPAGFNEKGPKLNQTATVKGLKPGEVTVSVERGGFGAYASADCNVIVYKPGDVDYSGSVDMKDSLRILKHSMHLLSLDEAGKKIADLNMDKKVDLKDAVLALKIYMDIL